jgi:hypothetical protein
MSGADPSVGGFALQSPPIRPRMAASNYFLQVVSAWPRPERLPLGMR